MRLCSHYFVWVCVETADLKQEERLQELESCSGVGSTSDDTEVREVSSRPSTPGLSIISGTNEDLFFINTTLGYPITTIQIS